MLKKMDKLDHLINVNGIIIYFYNLIPFHLLLTELNLSESHIPDFPYTNSARLRTRYLVIRLFLETKNRTLVLKLLA